MKKKLIYAVLCAFCFSMAKAQEQEEVSDNAVESKVDLSGEKSNTYKLRLDLLSVGFPSLVTFGGEYLLPIPVKQVENKLAVYGKYGVLGLLGDIDVSSSFEDFGSNVEASVVTYEFGLNYYLFGKKGSGLYVGGGFNAFDVSLSNVDASTLFSNDVTGNLDLEVTQFGFNARVGVRVGNRVYFRLEAGYTQFIDNVIAKMRGQVSNTGGDFTLSFDDNSEVKLNGLLDDFPPVTLNFALGYAFLK